MKRLKLFFAIFLIAQISSAVCAAPVQHLTFEDILRAEGISESGIEKIKRETLSRNVTNISALIVWFKAQKVKNVGAMIEKFSWLLSIGPDVDLDAKTAWLKRQGVKQVGAFIEKAPQFLLLDINNNLQKKADWLTAQKVKKIGATIEKSPPLLGLSIEYKLNPTVRWLISWNVEEPGAVIERAPSILNFDIETNLNVKALRLSLLGVIDVGAVIEKFPQILTYSIEKGWEPKLVWMKVTGIKNPGAFIEKFPQVMGLSILTSLNPKVDWLQDQKFQNPGAMIELFPPLLSYSLDNNLKPTFIELTEFWGLTVADIESQPMLMGASLNRLQLMRHWAEAAGINVSPLDSSTKKETIQNLKVEKILGNLIRAAEVATNPYSEKSNERSQILAEGLDRLRATENLALIFRKYQTPKKIRDCAIVLDGGWQ